VTVPNGGHCVLVGTTVDGSTSVGRNASLELRGADVDGDVEAEDAWRQAK
jgi:hypothetical protein